MNLYLKYDIRAKNVFNKFLDCVICSESTFIIKSSAYMYFSSNYDSPTISCWEFDLIKLIGDKNIFTIFTKLKTFFFVFLWKWFEAVEVKELYFYHRYMMLRTPSFMMCIVCIMWYVMRFSTMYHKVVKLFIKEHSLF